MHPVMTGVRRAVALVRGTVLSPRIQKLGRGQVAESLSPHDLLQQMNAKARGCMDWNLLRKRCLAHNHR